MDMGQDRDEWLMAQVAAGHTEQLEALVRRHGTPLLNFIRHMVTDHQRSEDLFQDVFLIVWAKRRQYRFPNPFKPWLFRIAVNRCRQVLRVRGLGRVLSLDGPDPPQFITSSSSPYESSVATEKAVLVNQAITRLPDRQRMVVAMRIWNDMSYADIALASGVGEATVRSQMHDALLSMRRHLESRLCHQ